MLLLRCLLEVGLEENLILRATDLLDITALPPVNASIINAVGYQGRLN